ncbi:MAG: four helix bundle protein [Planctomycetota bacterium]
MAGGFEDLDVYKEARILRRRVYKLTKQLPKDEMPNLFRQMRRAALSVTNNIAEGHGSRGFRHNMSYLYRSRGSVNELMDDINTCLDEGYFQPEHLADLRKQAVSVVKLINGYIAYLRGRMTEADGKAR